VEKAVLEKEADVGLIEEYTSSQSKVVVVTSYASGTVEIVQLVTLTVFFLFIGSSASKIT